jgi:hypothetical protein
LQLFEETYNKIFFSFFIPLTTELQKGREDPDKNSYGIIIKKDNADHCSIKKMTFNETLKNV